MRATLVPERDFVAIGLADGEQTLFAPENLPFREYLHLADVLDRYRGGSLRPEQTYPRQVWPREPGRLD